MNFLILVVLPAKIFLNVCVINITLKEGRLPEKKGEIVISQKAIEDGAKVSVGDTFEAEYFERTVTGIQEGVTSIFPFSSLKLEYGETKKVSQEFPFYEENLTCEPTF